MNEYRLVRMDSGLAVYEKYNDQVKCVIVSIMTVMVKLMSDVSLAILFVDTHLARSFQLFQN